jgi:hypothetical protein
MSMVNNPKHFKTLLGFLARPNRVRLLKFNLIFCSTINLKASYNVFITLPTVQAYNYNANSLQLKLELFVN